MIEVECRYHASNFSWNLEIFLIKSLNTVPQLLGKIIMSNKKIDNIKKAITPLRITKIILKDKFSNIYLLMISK
jgi:hypothetical protein